MRTVKVSTFYDTVDGVTVQKDKVNVYLTSAERNKRPTAGIAEGSLSFESDTGMIGAFNESDGEWVDQFSVKE